MRTGQLMVDHTQMMNYTEKNEIILGRHAAQLMIDCSWLSKFILDNYCNLTEDGQVTWLQCLDNRPIPQWGMKAWQKEVEATEGKGSILLTLIAVNRNADFGRCNTPETFHSNETVNNMMHSLYLPHSHRSTQCIWGKNEVYPPKFRRMICCCNHIWRKEVCQVCKDRVSRRQVQKHTIGLMQTPWWS